ncbi:ribonuclease P protein subunit, partial [Cricetulus griseus]
VSFLIPECGLLPKELKSLAMEFGPYYSVKNLPLHELVTHEFIHTFVKKAVFFGIVNPGAHVTTRLQEI